MKTTQGSRGLLIGALLCNSACLDYGLDAFECTWLFGCGPLELCEAGACVPAQSGTLLTDRLRVCELLTDGTYYADELTLSDCRAECVNRATCDDLRGSWCGGDGAALSKCLDACPSTLDFVCDDGQESHRCDRNVECAGGEDEDACPWFHCEDDLWVPWFTRCNGFENCGNGADERDCPGFTCELESRSGGTRRGTIPQRWVCDGDPDCVNGEDEPEGCAELVCSSAP